MIPAILSFLEALIEVCWHQHVVPVAILLGSLQWIRNAALSTRFSFSRTRGNRRGPGQVSRQGGEQWSCYFCQEFLHNERGVCRRIVMVQQPASILPRHTSFAPHIFPQSSQNLAVNIPIDNLTRWNKLLMQFLECTQQENSYTKHAITNRMPVTAMLGRVNEASHWNLLTKYCD